MISVRMADAINGQINAELYSAYLYLSMRSYFDATKLPGCANWMRVQAMEEFTHADRLYRYLNESGARATMTAIDGPPTEWDSALAVFQAVQAHEQKVTGLINALVDLATEENDQATVSALQWFVKEQEEEEESAEGVVRKAEQAGQTKEGLAKLDEELARRAFHPPKTS
ncbi:MAG: ferritin [Planctomycetes bacterium SM23_65]|nr:MAG: ferritin [Planctomycetes bacterium SM23_65]